MPWCPICKNEYRDGFTTCAECKVELVANFEDIPMPIYAGSEYEVQAMVNFLKEVNYEDASVVYDKDADIYQIYVKKENVKAATIALRDFETSMYSKGLDFSELGLIDDEPMDMDEGNDEAEQMIAELVERQNAASNPIPLQSNYMQLVKEAEKRRATSVYQNKHDKAEEYKSSAGALMIVGVLGLALIIVNELGLIPITLNFNKPMVYGVMGTVFVFFIIFSFVSMSQYKKALQHAEEEDQLVNKIKEFMESQGIKDQILAEEKNTGGLSEENLYFVRTAKMKHTLMEQFSEAEEILVDKMVDDYYEEWFA